MKTLAVLPAELLLDEFTIIGFEDKLATARIEIKLARNLQLQRQMIAARLLGFEGVRYFRLSIKRQAIAVIRRTVGVAKFASRNHFFADHSSNSPAFVPDLWKAAPSSRGA